MSKSKYKLQVENLKTKQDGSAIFGVISGVVAIVFMLVSRGNGNVWLLAIPAMVFFTFALFFVGRWFVLNSQQFKMAKMLYAICDLEEGEVLNKLAEMKLIDYSSKGYVGISQQKMLDLLKVFPEYYFGLVIGLLLNKIIKEDEVNNGKYQDVAIRILADCIADCYVNSAIWNRNDKKISLFISGVNRYCGNNGGLITKSNNAIGEKDRKQVAGEQRFIKEEEERQLATERERLIKAGMKILEKQK